MDRPDFDWAPGTDWYCDGYKTTPHNSLDGVIRADLGTALGSQFWCPECLRRRIIDLLAATKDHVIVTPGRYPTEPDFDYRAGGCYCSRCCNYGEDSIIQCGADAHNHAVIFIDTGEGKGHQWLCSRCFDTWLDGVLAHPVTIQAATVATPITPMLVDGETVTIDGVTFEF